MSNILIKNACAKIKKPYLFFTFKGGHIKIHSHSDIPVQVDGEPWIQPPGDVVVFNSALKVSIYHR